MSSFAGNGQETGQIVLGEVVQVTVVVVVGGIGVVIETTTATINARISVVIETTTINARISSTSSSSIVGTHQTGNFCQMFQNDRL